MNIDMIDELTAVDRLPIPPWPWPRCAADGLLDKLPSLNRQEVAA